MAPRDWTEGQDSSQSCGDALVIYALVAHGKGVRHPSREQFSQAETGERATPGSDLRARRLPSRHPDIGGTKLPGVKSDGLSLDNDRHRTHRVLRPYSFGTWSD